MTKIELPLFVEKIVDDLKTNVSTKSIWLVGSRANSSARQDSDWDLLVFVDEELSPVKARDSRVDVIRVDAHGKYLLEGQSESNSFSNWCWNDLGNREARYSVRVCPQAKNDGLIDLSLVQIKTLHGCQIWSYHA